MEKWRLSFFAGLLMVLAPLVFAQSDTHRQIQQIEQQRQDSLKRAIEQQQRERGRVLTPGSRDYSSSGSSEQCFAIHELRIQGLSLFSRDDMTSVIDSYQGKCLGAQQLDGLLNDIAAFYFNRGYVTTRAYLTEQDLSSGVLQVRVVEGILQSIEPGGVKQTSGSRSLDKVFPGATAKPLNLRDLEQGLENINRLQSYKATMKLLPGAALGATRVEVAQQTTKPWQLQLKNNNSGQSATGEQQLQGLLSWDNPLGLYDFGYLSYQTDIEASRDNFYSESLALHWDWPLGYWSLNVDLTQFRYQHRVAGNALDFSASGETETQKLSAGRLLFRNADAKARIQWALTRKRTRNYVEDVLLDISSRTLALSDLTLTYERYFPAGAFLLSELTYTRGLHAFGSPDDNGIANDMQSETPKAQFDRYSLLLDYRRPFQWFGQSFQYKTQWNTQYSPDVLFGSEQITIGSLYSVRGYKAPSLSGNSGSYWRNDLSWIIRPRWGGGIVSVISPYIGVDIGRVFNSFQGEGNRSLKGWSLGLLAQGAGWSAELSFSNPLSPPGDLPDLGEEVSASLNFIF